ncbi:MAG: hypothetical protein WDM85_19790 [Caulobacteraceae bacterium]
MGPALSGKAGEALRAQALPRLERLLPQVVLRDGVHASRSPERGLELLFDLLALDDALSQLGAPAPVEVSRAIDRLATATRFFHPGDGRLAAFQGGEPAAPERIAAAVALDAAERGPPKSAPYGGYHRLEGRGLQIIADAGEIANPLGAAAACLQPGALSVLCDGRRLIAGSAWSARGAADPVLREPLGGSLPGARRRPAQPGSHDRGAPGERRRGLARVLARRLARSGLRLHAPAVPRHRGRRTAWGRRADAGRTAASAGPFRDPLPPRRRRRRPALRRRQERAAAPPLASAATAGACAATRRAWS